MAKHRREAVVFHGQAREEVLTVDEALLGSDGDEWTGKDPWRVFRVQIELVGEFDTLHGLPVAVSILGSARIASANPMCRAAKWIARDLTERRFTVIIGGGPGIMEAGDKGTSEAGGTSAGLGIELPHEQGLNPYVGPGIDSHYFFVRKTMFPEYSHGFIVMSGGFDALDELFELLTLIQIDKVIHFPVVLFGSRLWEPPLDWIEREVEVYGFISPDDLGLVTFADDIGETVAAMSSSVQGWIGRLGTWFGFSGSFP